MFKKLFSYKDGTGPTSPQKKIIKSKIGTGHICLGPFQRNWVHFVKFGYFINPIFLNLDPIPLDRSRTYVTSPNFRLNYFFLR